MRHLHTWKVDVVKVKRIVKGRDGKDVEVEFEEKRWSVVEQPSRIARSKPRVVEG